jgi:hypothetical protein
MDAGPELVAILIEHEVGGAGGGAVCATLSLGIHIAMPARTAAAMNEPSVLTLMLFSFRTTALHA